MVRSVVGHTCADEQVEMMHWVAALVVGDADAAVVAPGVVVVVVVVAAASAAAVAEGIAEVAVAANAAVVGVASVWMVLAVGPQIVGLAKELVVAIETGGVVGAPRSGSKSVASESQEAFHQRGFAIRVAPATEHIDPYSWRTKTIHCGIDTSMPDYSKRSTSRVEPITHHVDDSENRHSY